MKSIISLVMASTLALALSKGSFRLPEFSTSDLERYQYEDFTQEDVWNSNLVEM
jgi:hypothetical protein